jgi:hypothetical protein
MFASSFSRSISRAGVSTSAIALPTTGIISLLIKDF